QERITLLLDDGVELAVDWLAVPPGVDGQALADEEVVRQRGRIVQHARIAGGIARRQHNVARRRAAAWRRERRGRQRAEGDDQPGARGGHGASPPGATLGPASEAMTTQNTRLSVVPSVTVIPSAARPGLSLRPSRPNDRTVVSDAVRMLTIVRADSSRVSVVSTRKIPKSTPIDTTSRSDITCRMLNVTPAATSAPTVATQARRPGASATIDLRALR